MHMAGYKLATYQSKEGPRAGIIVDDKVFDAAKLTGKAAYASGARHHRGLEVGPGDVEEGRR